mmetsp:Transcript_11639/g.25513  ORF Transcript_11639/g.25513 Transcript_11639/m.25513 type:complete len:452 (+) Transcript_11639:723-2078(+)
MFMSTQLLLILSTIFQSLHVCHSKLHSTAASATVTSKKTVNNDGAAVLAPVPTFTLANNITIPLVGLGSASGVTYPHVQSAIGVGYRYVDTAQSHSWGYREEDVGKAVHDVKRDWYNDGNTDEYVFVQTKIHPQDLGYHSTQKAIQLSLKRLKVTSLDSVLIHKPRCWEGICSHEPEGTWQDSWVALEEAVDAGTVRSIGICDVDNQLLDELLQKRIGPMVIQNWFDPFHQDTHFRRRIERHNQLHPESKILYQGYSSLGTQWFHHKGYTENPVLNHPTLQSIAQGYGATVPQVVIQWATRQGVMVLPASRNRSHQMSNLNSFHFTLSDEEMRAIDGLDGNPPAQPKPKEKNPNEVQLQFVNRAEGAIHAYWVPDEGSSESDHVKVGEMKGLGDALKITSYHGDAFVFKEGVFNEGGGGWDTTSKILNHHVVDKSLGLEQNHDIDDRSEEL